jgi:hypothetical protein
LGGFKPISVAKVWNLDTAVAYNGSLTAICGGTKEIGQSDPAHIVYKEENGRNGV